LWPIAAFWSHVCGFWSLFFGFGLAHYYKRKKREIEIIWFSFVRKERKIALGRHHRLRLPRSLSGAQLNKGEALHAPRGFLFVANGGKIRRHYDEEQLNQVSCLDLVTNAVVPWNTVYMSAVLDQLRSKAINRNPT
jgi:TnpA family transposase